MSEYYIDKDGKDVFSVADAKSIVEKLNKISAKFGTKYRVERSGMTIAKIIKEDTEGGILKKPKSKIRISKKRGGC